MQFAVDHLRAVTSPQSEEEAIVFSLIRLLDGERKVVRHYTVVEYTREAYRIYQCGCDPERSGSPRLSHGSGEGFIVSSISLKKLFFLDDMFNKSSMYRFEACGLNLID